MRLLDQSRVAHVVDRKEADRKKAVLLTARADDKLESNAAGARDDALQALKLSADFVPAALIAAKALFRENGVSIPPAQREIRILEGGQSASALAPRSGAPFAPTDDGQD